MYTKNNKIIADAGEILIYKNMSGFSFDDVDGVKAEKVDINSITLKNGIFRIGRIRLMDNKNWDFGNWKSRVIKLKYSNDDQIAIMLNKDNSDEDRMYFDKMQEWRDWASEIAKAIIIYPRTLK